jgi:hypothetical protein
MCSSGSHDPGIWNIDQSSQFVLAEVSTGVASGNWNLSP